MKVTADTGTRLMSSSESVELTRSGCKRKNAAKYLAPRRARALLARNMQGKSVALCLAHALALSCCGALVACEQASVPVDHAPRDLEDAGALEPVEPDARDAGASADMRCIDVRQQPAALYLAGSPKLPPRLPRGLGVGANSGAENADPPLEDAHCPEGTTPYYDYGFNAALPTWAQVKQRSNQERLATLVRAKRTRGEHEDDDALEPRLGSRDPHQHAVAYAWQETHGVSARVSVWQPELEHTSDFSLAQVWVVGGVDGGYAPENAETIEAGFQVSRGIYGDDEPRLFGFWTNDGYRSGCYNLACAGFVQVSSRFGLGARFVAPARREAPSEPFVRMLIVRDDSEGDWWLALDGHWIGYWPGELFSDEGLREHGELLELGGEVYSAHSQGSHTRTEMGSGVLVRNARTEQAAWISHVRSIEKDGSTEAPSLMLEVTDRQCYGAALLSREDAGRNPSLPTLLFGGPGYSTYCQ